jgi:hypothetical protein
VKTSLDLERERLRACHVKWARDCLSTNERGTRKFVAQISLHPTPDGLRDYAQKMREAADAADRLADKWSAFLAIAEDAGANDGPIRA